MAPAPPSFISYNLNDHVKSFGRSPDSPTSTEIVLLESIETALVTAYKKNYECEDENVKITMDKETGEVFEVENSDPIITWERIDESEKPVCVQGKSGGIQFTVKNVKKEWLKLEGYLEFTDAEGKIPDWKVTHKVQYDEKSMFATRTNCIDYVPKKLKACYIPDPSKPNEFNSYLRV